jgi:hypothetical protein
MKRFFIFLLLLLPTLVFSKGHTTAYENPFSIVFGGQGTNIYGDYYSIASSVECVEKADHTCNNSYTGNLYDATTKYLKSVSTSVIPLNSSTEMMSLPSDINGTDILYAGLFWQGHIAGTDANDYTTGIVGRDTVSMQDSDGNLHTLTADKMWYHDFWGDDTGNSGGYRSFYQGYKDVTNILQNSYTQGQTNDYTVGNIKSSVGEDHYQYFWTVDADYSGIKMGFYGNWNLIVVYQHPNVAILSPIPKAKNITIFYGFDALIPLPATTDSRTKTIDLDLAGFLTPSSTPIAAKLLFYGSGGEKSLQYDSLQIQDKKTTNYVDLFDASNPIDDAFNGSVSSFGVPVDNTITYYPGLDSDDFNISAAMDTKQTATSLKLTAKFPGNSGDQFFPGLIAFSTDIYVPRFCYDYAYKQQQRYFTEDNDGSQNPRITGDVVKNEDINVTIFIRNLVDSDLAVENMKVNITDINTSQVTYISDSTALTKTGQLNPIFFNDSSLNVGGTYIKDIPIGNMGSNDYFYLYYGLTPQTTTLDMPINVSATYDLVLNSTTTIPYTLTVGSNLQMCSSTNFKYTPQKGLFNLVNDLYYSSSSNYYNNLPTAVTSRPDNYKVVSYDANDSNLNTLKETNTTVAVELIDAAAFHDTFASCKEPSSSISDKIWVTLKNSKTTPFTAQDIVNSFLTKDGTGINPDAAKQFFSTARENAAFRISWDNDLNGSMIQTIETAPNSGLYHLENFSDYATQDCVSPVTTDVETSPAHFVTKTFTQVAQACYNAGSSSASAMNNKELAACMECIYGKALNYVCSRDNFSIRPEAFLIQLKDQNQTDPVTKTNITTLANSGSDGASAPILNLASGYNYNIDINATNHYTNDASLGYTKTMNVTDADTAKYFWEPRSVITAGACNDENNKSITMRFVKGVVDKNTSVDQVGEYKLSLKDTTWTTVDSNPAFMLHHNDDLTHFLPSSTSDCTLNSSIVPVVGNATLVGCDISSNHVSNVLYYNGTSTSVQHITYNDYNVTFHPYEFAVSNIVTLGEGNVSPAVMREPTKPFVYMSNLSQDENMSVHLNTTVTARGRNSATSLTNYVTGCFAKPINLTISKTATINPALTYDYWVHNKDINGTVLPANDIQKTIIAGNTTENPAFTTTSSFFQKDQNGTVQLLTNLNYIRNVNVTANPEDINFKAISADDNATLINADLVADKYAEGNTTVNQRVLYYYGRTIAPKITVVCNANTCRTGISATNNNNMKELISYAIYCQGGSCNGAILPAGALQVGDVRWFENRNHDTSGQPLTTDGGIGIVTEVSNTGNVSEISRVINTPFYENEEVIEYSGPLPYDAIMQMQSSPWLIYNENNATATTNQFIIQFVGDGGWSGKHEDNTTTKTNFSTTTNRRIMW